jgi:putative transposase
MAKTGETKTYPSDLRDEEWTLLDPLIPRARKAGRPEKYPKRAILNAIFYLVRSGCAWRMLPSDLPPWKLVWHYFAHWKKQGVWAQLNDALRDAVRLQAGKKKPRPLRSSTRRACAQLSRAGFVATMLARRWRDESDIFWSIRWD